MFSVYLCFEVTMVDAILAKPGIRMCCGLHFKEEEMGIGIRRQCICARELTSSGVYSEIFMAISSHCSLQ